MIRRIDEGLQAVQRALFALEHYGTEHPAVARALGRAHESLDAATREHGEVRVIGVGGRVVALDRTLPSSSSLTDGLFARLEERGATSLTLAPGLAIKDLSGLCAWLSGHEESWSGTPGVRTGSVEAARDAPAPSDPDARSTTLDPAAHAMAVREVWTAVSREDWRKSESVESVVSAICSAVTGSGGMMIPLAHLKRHDEYTFVHTTNVAILSASLAEAVGLGDSKVLDLTTAALLHDVGKRAVPRALLNKKNKLSDHELAIMRRHPVLGARLLFDSRRVPDVVPIVAFEHHIHLDGSGYPHVRQGWRTSLASQIVQVADVYDALRTNRPYRAALSRQVAFDIMMRDAGIRFDEQLLRVFFERVADRTEREAMPEVWESSARAA